MSGLFTRVLLSLGLAFGGAAQASEATDWPRAGQIVYRVLHGDNGLHVGRATHTWQHDGARYRMQSVVETTGLAALFKSFHYTQVSEGAVTARGLRPDLFTVDQRGKPFQRARFDWTGGRVHIDRGDSTREAPIHAGDQDVLSIAHQLRPQRSWKVPPQLTIVNNKSAALASVRDLGTAPLRLPFGTLETRHYAVRAEDGKVRIDVWLAPAHQGLPVRIRIENRKGDVLDQQAERIDPAPTPAEAS